MHSLIQQIERSVVGQHHTLTTCFGKKPLVYADYTASGRGLSFIEDYIQHHVLPWYANTHTETSFTGAQTTGLREEARHIIRQAVNGSAEDKVIFCGAGATTGINKLIDILGMRIPHNLDVQYQLASAIPANERPVVFIGAYEHHSNELPWRESLADVVAIPLNDSGQIDEQILEAKLIEYQGRPLKIGSFSAASNVTGIRTDVQSISRLLKAYDALSFWDYAAASPYVKIDMNAATPLDAVFISPHKFIGGPGTSGVLVVKQSVLTNEVPAIVGGGTVLYVTPDGHRFIADHERREEGGTPAIVESIRTGLVFKLQQEVSTEVIEQKEQVLVARVLRFLQSIPQIEVLGNVDAPRLSIFSLRFTYQGQDLHYGFITALLNDLFGIQVRGGCSCAGPYGHFLLGMNREYSQKLEKEIQQGAMVLRPGWVRLNVNYFISEAELAYLCQAIKLVAEHGWRLLPFYQLDETNAVWRFQGEKTPLPESLLAFNFAQMPATPAKADTPDYDALLTQAKALLMQPNHRWQPFTLSLSPTAEALRWFVLPQSCLST